ncbi:tetratricopeptide repeat protein [Polystyrenella longa]|uniref:Tetratricopeptide repeat protein n=1 Tax=Polystyrenella longa TaxID=2528007 RepID=A0A518CL44_9PLAN|nr:tetratricopeptide repeat protein [Polystyrenella longa]QDU79939.1 tetratricopeptide repeat protein [Polystyrenella longa]
MNWSPQAHTLSKSTPRSRESLSLNKLFGIWGFVVMLSGLLFVSIPSKAAESDPVQTESSESETSDSEKTPLEIYVERQQKLPIIIENLQFPDLKESPTEKDINKREALAHFLTARLLFNRNAHQQALSELQKAADLDPTSSEVYELLIPLAIGMNQSELVEKYVSKAEDADPENYELLVRVGRYMQRQNRMDEAIRLIRRATESSRIDHKSGEYVLFRFELGLLLTLTKDLEKAAEAYEVVFDAMIHPEEYELNSQIKARLMADRAQSLERIGRAFLDGDRLDLAEQAFEAASEFGTGKPAILGFNLASVYVKKGDYEKGLNNLQAYFDARLQTKGRDAYELLEQLLEKLDRSDDLIPSLEKLADNDPRNSKLKYFLAEQYIENDKLDEAEKLIKSTLESRGDPEGLISLAEIYFQRRQAEPLLDTMATAFKSQQNINALQDLMNRIEEDPELTKALMEVGESRLEENLGFEGALLMGKLAEKAKRSDLVSKFYTYALAERGDQAFRLYQSWGEYLMQQEEYEQAVEVWAAAGSESRLNSYRPIFLSREADAQVELENFEKAIAAVKKARSIRDTNEFHFQEAWIQYRASNDEEAIKLFEDVRTKKDINPRLQRSIHLILSNLYVQKGDITNGEKVLEDFIKFDPENPTVNNDLGYLYADQGKNLEQAEKMIRKAVDSDPDNAAFLDSLGWVLYKLGKPEEAITHLEKAIKILEEGDPTIYNHLGDCHYALGNKEEARKVWETALEKEKAAEAPNEKLVKELEEKLSSEKEATS